MPDATYYGNINSELLRWIPLGARRVLEVGCGEGALGAAYKRRNPLAWYVAVEAHPPAALVARERLDEVLEVDFAALPEQALGALGLFDAIVLGDVLEHCADPWFVLSRLKSLLAKDGRLVISVPNVSHWSALANLIRGHWPVAESGIFERTHLRFFTLSSLATALRECGFEVERARSRDVPPDNPTAQTWLPILLKAAVEAGQKPEEFLQRARTLQYIVEARDAAAPPATKLHIHVAALAPTLLDVRTRQPAEMFEADPGLTISYREKSGLLPDMPRDSPKLALLQRMVMPEPDHWRRYLTKARADGWSLIYEIDDHPDLVGQVLRNDKMAEQIKIAVRGCHAVQTSTARLAEVLRPLNPHVRVFENAVKDLPPFSPAPRVDRVFYGALNRYGASAAVAEALAPAIEAHPHLEFVVLADRAFFDALPTSRKVLHGAMPYADYLDQIARCQVALSPLEGREAEAFKSDVKFLEAARAGVAMIASPCVYADTITPMQTGLIASSLTDWATGLDLLIRDPDLRNRIAQSAWAYVKAERMLAPQVAARVTWYREVHENREALDADLLSRCPEFAG